MKIFFYLSEFFYCCKVIGGKVKNIKSCFFLFPDQENSLTISFNPRKIFYKSEILVKNREGFVNKKFCDVSFTSVTNYQLFSLVASFIPFFQHNDANRTLMGIGMQKQAVNLLSCESAIVMSGIFNQLIANGNFVTLSSKSGLLTFFSDKKIYLKSSVYLGKSLLRNSSFFNKMSSKISLKKFLKVSFTNIFSMPSILESSGHFLKSNFSNDIFRINKRDILYGNNRKNSRVLGIGKNLFLAYMTWKGYNFEDAIVINERLITNDLFTSVHVKKYIIFLLKGKLGKVWIFN